MPIGLFIDAAYLYQVAKKLSPDQPFLIDYKKLREIIEQKLGDSIDEAYYFGADDDPPRALKLTAYLQNQYPDGPGFRVKMYWLSKKLMYWPNIHGGGPVMHPTKPGVQLEQWSQKGVDVGLVYHMTNSFHRRKWNKLVLAAGDGDFHEPVQNLVEGHNVDLHILGSKASISSELRAFAKSIIEIDQPPLAQDVISQKQFPV